MTEAPYTLNCCFRLRGPTCERWPLSSKSSIAPERGGVGVFVGVGVGTVGVFDGVAVLVSVLILMNVGVGVNVAVGGRVVGEGCDVDVNTVGVYVGVLVGREEATVGGTSIPVNRRAVAPSPMKRPIPRYLMLLRMVDRIFLVRGPVERI